MKHAYKALTRIRDVRRQLAFMLARSQFYIDVDTLDDVTDDEKDTLRAILSNVRCQYPSIRNWGVACHVVCASRVSSSF